MARPRTAPGGTRSCSPKLGRTSPLLPRGCGFAMAAGCSPGGFRAACGAPKRVAEFPAEPCCQDLPSPWPPPCTQAPEEPVWALWAEWPPPPPSLVGRPQREGRGGRSPALWGHVFHAAAAAAAGGVWCFLDTKEVGWHGGWGVEGPCPCPQIRQPRRGAIAPAACACSGSQVAARTLRSFKSVLEMSPPWRNSALQM